MFANAGSALEIARRQKYEALLLEVDDVEGARDLLAQVRNVPFNRNSILFGITHRRTSFRTAFEQGANFVLEKPLAPDRALRSVRAAHALMLRERRRTFRHNIDTVVLLQLGRGAETRARGVDLSEGGMAIYLSVPPTLGHEVAFRFLLPETGQWLEGRCVIAWIEQNRVGLQFTTVRKDLKVDLANWLTTQLDHEFSAPLPAPMPPSSARPAAARSPRFATLDS